MDTDNLRLTNAATARAYLRGVAEKIDDPQKLFAFLSACEVCQAALVHCLHKEQHIEYLQQSRYGEDTPGTAGTKSELETAWDAYRHATREFLFSKQRLKDIICALPHYE